MEKVKLTSVQAEVIENLKKTYYDNANMVSMCVIGEFKDERIVNLQLDDIIRSLYIGYEVELTPEERILNMFKQFEKEECKHDYEFKWIMGFRTGIIRTLQELGIEIKGITE